METWEDAAAAAAAAAATTTTTAAGPRAPAEREASLTRVRGWPRSGCLGPWGQASRSRAGDSAATAHPPPPGAGTWAVRGAAGAGWPI